MRLESARALIGARDDATVEPAHLYLDVDRPDQARVLLAGRHFQPREGGEGKALAACDRTCPALAECAMGEGRPEQAVALVEAALSPPQTLGGARHPLADPAHLHLLRGDALDAVGGPDAARAAWRVAADTEGDFRLMSTESHSEATYARVLAMRRLDQDDASTATVVGLTRFCEQLEASPATVDYFATSLPDLLLFTADQRTLVSRRVAFLRARLDVLAGDTAAALARLRFLLAEDPSRHAARDLKRDLTRQEAHGLTTNPVAAPSGGTT
jgi:hypothetical protein